MSSEMEAMDKAKEAAEEAKERKHLAPVSLTMAILAVLVATVSLLGHRAHTEEILLQTGPPTSGPTTRQRTCAAITWRRSTSAHCAGEHQGRTRRASAETLPRRD